MTVFFRGAFASAAIAMIAACGNGASNAVPGPLALRPNAGSPSSPIQHVVLLVQENRSFDNFFDCFTGTDCVKRGKERISLGGKYVDKWVPLQEQDLVPKVNNTDIGHCYYAFYVAYDGGKLDGFNREPWGTCPRNWPTKVKRIGTFPYAYIKPSEIAPYWDMAQQYVLADRMFQTQGSGSFTAHQDLIRGGTAIGGTYGSSPSLIDTPDGEPWGCDARSPSANTNLITTSLKWEKSAGPFPCSKDFPSGSSAYTTMRDVLDAGSVSWKYYSPCFADSGPGCNNGCTTCAGALLNAFDVIWPVRNGKEWGTNVSMPQTNIFRDISKGTLPAVAWVIPSQADSDHPGGSVDHGPAWVASVVNAIGESSYWSSTAIIVVWDDWGGLYDHVKPAFRDDQGGLGFRVPMIVISPYAPQGVVSHTQYEFGSILRYIEENWNLGSLGTTDQRATSIGDVFNYKQKPRTFMAIPSDHSTRFFLAEPPSGPEDPE